MRFTLWNTGADPGEFLALAQAAEGCGWPWSLRTAARIGDGWCGVPGPIDEITRTTTELPALVDEAGRDRSGFEIHAGALDAVTPDDHRRPRDAGVTDAVVMPWLGGDFPEPRRTW